MSRVQETFLSEIFFCRGTALILLLVTGLTCGSYVFAEEEDSGLPGVLRYAQTYEGNKAKAEKKENTSGQAGEDKKVQVLSVYRDGVAHVSELRRRLQQRERELKKLRNENRSLQQNVADLKKTVTSGTVQALQVCTEKVNQQTKSEEDAQAILKNQLQEKEGQNQKQKEALESCLTSVQEKEKRVEQSVSDNKALMEELEKRQTEMPVIQKEELETPEQQQAYAAGVMLGREIRTLQEAQMLLGLKTDNHILIAGLNDLLSNRVLLSGEELDRALAQAEKSTLKATLNVIDKQKKAGAAWVDIFRKKKGVKQAKSGFWYRLDYSGDGALINGDASTVEVVVTEKLTDGTVVEDMDAQGRSLSMALGDFPPLFREALKLMKNHGTMTLVAPPELTYGNEGYPPKVPPGATMVYTLRVDNVKLIPDIVLPEPAGTGKLTDDRTGNRKP
ncbi:FKBP-type peptidyl-prolyl cis-trans isomerase [Salmonella enterica]|nr:peptidylprolyl isomerase [Salmonella enterica subsp. enterica serovar Oslo]EHW8352256.1 FKBP-type peptidyl-prolyl cis-trans isomerase [Salmonella enterica]EHW8353110.1 FKBP-type peptidyl-prolyl cis-trans isomerase [Salmonella enterica]